MNADINLTKFAVLVCLVIFGFLIWIALAAWALRAHAKRERLREEKIQALIDRDRYLKKSDK